METFASFSLEVDLKVFCVTGAQSIHVHTLVHQSFVHSALIKPRTGIFATRISKLKRGHEYEASCRLCDAHYKTSPPKQARLAELSKKEKRKPEIPCHTLFARYFQSKSKSNLNIVD